MPGEVGCEYLFSFTQRHYENCPNQIAMLGGRGRENGCKGWVEGDFGARFAVETKLAKIFKVENKKL